MNNSYIKIDTKDVSCHRNQRHQLINTLLLIVFFLHNILFFFQGANIDWHSESWIKYIKYIILLFFLIFNWKWCSFRRFLIFILIFSFFLLQQFVAYIITNFYPDFSVMLNFYAALTLILISPKVFEKKFLFWGLCSVAIIGILFTFIEYFFLQNIITKNLMNCYGFYRCGSFFINSNSAGSFFALSSLLFVHLITHKKEPFLFFCFFILAGLAILLTKSRSSLLLYGLIYCILLFKIRNKIFLVLNIIIIFSIFMFGDAKDIIWEQIIERADATESTIERYRQIVAFFDAFMENPFYPQNIYGKRFDMGAIQIIFDFGLLGFFFIVFMLIYCISKNFLKKEIIIPILFISLLSCFITTHNIFPWAYITVFFISMSIFPEKNNNFAQIIEIQKNNKNIHI